MTLYSSREPFNDDPHPNVWSGHTERNQMRTDTDTFRKGAPSYLNYEGNYIVRPRPEYDRPQHNPTNPILVEFRKLHEETGNDLWTDAYLAWSDRIEEEWGTRDEYRHAFSVLGKIVASKKGGPMKRYKVVQDARGYWGIWDRENDDFASWGYHGDSGAADVYYIIEYSSMLNSGQMAKENFDWYDEYLPRENA